MSAKAKMQKKNEVSPIGTRDPHFRIQEATIGVRMGHLLQESNLKKGHF